MQVCRSFVKLCQVFVRFCKETAVYSDCSCAATLFFRGCAVHDCVGNVGDCIWDPSQVCRCQLKAFFRKLRARVTSTRSIGIMKLMRVICTGRNWNRTWMIDIKAKALFVIAEGGKHCKH